MSSRGGFEVIRNREPFGDFPAWDMSKIKQRRKFGRSHSDFSRSKVSWFKPI